MSPDSVEGHNNKQGKATQQHVCHLLNPGDRRLISRFLLAVEPVVGAGID